MLPQVFSCYYFIESRALFPLDFVYILFPLVIYCFAQDLAKKDHVNSVHLKLQAIARRVEAMQAENDYERVQVYHLE